MPRPSHVANGYNPLCGDTFKIFLQINAAGVIQDVSFQGSGCAISKASASLMTTSLKGKALTEAEKIVGEFHNLITGKTADGEVLGKLKAFSGIQKYPARVKCASLSWHAAKAAWQNQGTVSTE